MSPSSTIRFCLCLFALNGFRGNVVSQEITTGVSGFAVPEKNNPVIGFTAMDLGYTLKETERFRWNGGMRIIGAAIGKRGGYFAFGYYSEWLARPSRPFQVGAGVALLAGGGAAAPDKDGWMLQSHFFARYASVKGLAFRAGVNYAVVSGGSIGGFSPVAGVEWPMITTNRKDGYDARSFLWGAVYSELGAVRSRGEMLGFAGAGAAWKSGNYFAGDFGIHALANEHGGYMQTLFSAGPAFGFGKFRLGAGGVVGVGGGGGVKTVGGALFGAQFAATYTGNRFHAGVKYQLVEAFSRGFGYRGIFVSLGRTFVPHKKTIPGWDLISKAYLGSDGFGNIGARFIGYEYKKLRLMGSTYWAFTHNRGAYAEGMFEATVDAPGNCPLYILGAAGVGAGAGINHRSASLICTVGLGIISPWTSVPMRLEAGYWKGGNIPQWSLSLSYRVGQ